MPGLTIDPELFASLGAFMSENPAEAREPGDLLAFRAATTEMYAAFTESLPMPPEVEHRVLTTESADEASVDLHWFSPSTPAAGATAAVVHAHGGGRVAGAVSMFAPFIAQFVASSGVPFLSVEYRLAPEFPGSKAGEDVFAGLMWLVGHAETLGVDPARIAVMGESAGGGLAASAAIMARSAGVRLARQILIYPQLDDRTVDPDPALAPVVGSMYSDNRAQWDGVLGDARGSADVPATIAAARLTDFAALAPAYLEVGSLDIFRDETTAYAQKLWKAGVDAELHVLPGLIHGWDHLPPFIGIHEGVYARRVAVLRAL
ncbi:alpha/beta hydrolase [Conyzicola nivalis]|uniref:Alpha/beta hydrolase n=1 Tax=Conyzicola nivalis TaxID=1477021 RepID=A0A916SME9_9MICO|nr:alpha/beta hydrolase fold domain-containing protein [Conyzicola nivalis]GGB07276.1 alpha/beta hydrolase [Conyzicola nivalis]